MSSRVAMTLDLNASEQRWRTRIERARLWQERQHEFAAGLRWYEARLSLQREVASAAECDQVSRNKPLDPASPSTPGLPIPLGAVRWLVWDPFLESDRFLP